MYYRNLKHSNTKSFNLKLNERGRHLVCIWSNRLVTFCFTIQLFCNSLCWYICQLIQSDTTLSWIQSHSHTHHTSYSHAHILIHLVFFLFPVSCFISLQYFSVLSKPNGWTIPFWGVSFEFLSHFTLPVVLLYIRHPIFISSCCDITAWPYQTNHISCILIFQTGSSLDYRLLNLFIQPNRWQTIQLMSRFVSHLYTEFGFSVFVLSHLFSVSLL